MKEIFIQYAGYHLWANKQLFRLMISLTGAQHTAEVKGSFPSIYQTVLHLLDAESIWWQRLKLEEKVVRPGQTFKGGFEALCAEVEQLDKQWLQWVQNATEQGLQHQFIYRDSKKVRHKQAVYQMLLHLFNHGTYHRGQLVTSLRQLGVEKIPATDFMIWSRKNKGLRS